MCVCVCVCGMGWEVHACVYISVSVYINVALLSVAHSCCIDLVTFNCYIQSFL